MQTKQFTGDTIDDVLAQVRGAFGEDAVILETRNVVRGGLAGFFGRAGIEVTAADRMPGAEAPAHAVDLLDTDGAADTAADPGDALDADEFLRRLGAHLAPPPAEGPADEPPPAAAAEPDAADAAGAGTESAEEERERARAIVEAGVPSAFVIDLR